jgi:hypothetical protein
MCRARAPSPGLARHTLWTLGLVAAMIVAIVLVVTRWGQADSNATVAFKVDNTHIVDVYP